MRLDKLIVSDAAIPAATAATPPATEVFVSEGAAGTAQIRIDAVFTPNDAGTKVRWRVLDEFDDEIAAGDFAGNALATLTPGRRRKFTVEAGYDSNTDGKLDPAANEVTHSMVVYVVKVIIGEDSFRMCDLDKMVSGAAIRPPQAMDKVNFSIRNAALAAVDPAVAPRANFDLTVTSLGGLGSTFLDAKLVVNGQAV